MYAPHGHHHAYLLFWFMQILSQKLAQLQFKKVQNSNSKLWDVIAIDPIHFICRAEIQPVTWWQYWLNMNQYSLTALPIFIISKCFQKHILVYCLTVKKYMMQLPCWKQRNKDQALRKSYPPFHQWSEHLMVQCVSGYVIAELGVSAP